MLLIFDVTSRFLYFTCIAILLQAGCNPPPSSFPDERVNLESLISGTTSISLPANLHLSWPRNLDVSPEGEFLLTDTQLYLIDQDGASYSTLSVEPCHPGFQMAPIKGIFLSHDQGIFMTNSGIWGYRFKPDGTCSHSVDEAFFPPKLHCIQDDGTFVGLRYGVPGKARISWMDADGLEKHGVSIDIPFPRLTRHMDGGALLCKPDGQVAYLHPLLAASYSYERSGSLQEILPLLPGRALITRDLPNEIPRGDIQAAATFLHRHMKGHVVVLGVFPLTSELMLIQYYIHGRQGYWVNIVDQRGEAYFAEDQPFDGRFWVNRGAMLYWIEEPQAEDESHSIRVIEVNLALLSR